jgi:hypothetical protein
VTLVTLPFHGDIRIGSRVQWGDLDWIVTDIEVRPYTVVPYVTMTPPKNRPGRGASHTVTNVLISDVELLP